MPPNIKDALADTMAIQDMKVDTNKFWIVDKVIPREMLGRGVWSVEKYIHENTSATLDAQQATGGVAPGCQQDRAKRLG